jgi:flagellar basal body-associated protein FliL
MKKKILMIVPIVVIALGAGYKLALGKPAQAKPEPKVHGTVYVLGKEFLVNLADGHFGKLTVGLVLADDDTSTVAEKAESGAKPPEGFGPMPQEAVVRDVITDALTGSDQSHLVDRSGREELKKEIKKQLKRRTDVHVEEVLLTDVTVQ